MFFKCDTSQTPALGVMDYTHKFQQQYSIYNVPLKWYDSNQAQQLSSVTGHSTFNNSLHLVTGVHTQNEESYWNRVVKRMNYIGHAAIVPWQVHMERETQMHSLYNLFFNICLCCLQ